MFKYKLGEDIFNVPAEEVDIFEAETPDAIRITDEITDPEEGKTNGVAEEGATVTPEPGQAPEITESDSVDTSSESPDPSDFTQESIISDLGSINDVREIDNRINIVAGEGGTITASDSPKRIFVYNELIKRRNQILEEGVSSFDDLIEFDDEAFDPNVPAPESRSYVKDGTAYLAGVPLVVDGELVGTQAEGIPLDEVVVTADKLTKDELSEKYNSFEKNMAKDLIDFLAVNRGVVEGFTLGTADFDVIQKLSEGQQDRREQYNALYADNKIDINFTRSLYNTISNSLATIANIDDQFDYVWHFLGTQNVSPELKEKNLKKLEQARLNLNKKDSYYLPTQRFDRLKEKDGVFEYALGGLAGVIDGAMAVATTVAQQPPGLFVNLFANSLNESLNLQAKSKNLTPAELVESGEFSITPAVVSTSLELGSEWARIGVISRYFNRLPMGAQKKYAATAEVFGKNGMQEMFQYTTQQFNQYASQGMNYRDSVIKATGDFFTPEAFESGLKGAFGSSAVVMTGSYLKASNAIKTSQEHKRIQGLLSELYQLDKAKYSKNTTAAQLKAINTAQVEIRKKLTAAVDTNDDLMSTLSDQQIEIVNQNYDILTSVNAEIDATRRANNLTDDQKASIIDGLETAQNQAAQEISNIRNTAEQFYSKLAKVKKETEGIDNVEVIPLSNTAEVESFLSERKDPRIDIKESSGQQGFFIPGVDGKPNTIVINKEVALNEQAVNVAAHEFLHYILYETLKNNPAASINLGNALLDELNKIDVDQIKDSNFKKRMELYQNEDIEVQMEEALTLFSDALATGDIKFDEGIYTKIGDKVRRALQKNFGVKVKFNKGRDVYNFIKDYNNSLEKGGITTAQQAVAQEGAEGELIPQTEQQVDEQIVKESRSEEASQRVQEIYEQQGPAGAFEIIEQFKPITSKLVERRSEAPGFDRQLLTDEIETGKRGIIDLISEYNPESGVPLAAFINTQLANRAIEASRRVLGEEFTEDVTEARGVVAEEAEADVEVVEPPKGPRKPTETTRFSDIVLTNLGVENKAEAEKQISDATNKAFEGKDITRFGQTKNVPVAVAEIYGKMFGVNPETIYDKKRNYSKKDAEGLTRIKQYLIDNATSDFARLPKTKDDFGKATFIPNNVMNALYTDGELTGTLKDYLDLIREKPVKPIYRDRVGQTIRGLFNTSIRNRMVEDLIPSKPERARAGVKFSKAKAKPKDVDKKLQEIAVATDINQATKIAGIKGKVTVNDDNRLEKQKQMQQAIIDAEIPSWMFEASKFGNFARRKVNGKYVDIPARGGLYYGKSDPAFQAALALAKTNDSKYNIKAPKRVNVNKAFTEQGQAQGADNLKALEFVANKLADAVAKGQMPVEIAALYISSGYQATSGIIKIAAPFKYKSKVFKYGTTPNQSKGEKFREEHNPPASVIGANLIYGIANNDMATILPAITKNYYQTQLSKIDDQKIDESDLAAKLPEGFSILDNSDIRLIKANIPMGSLVNPITGETIAQKLGVTIESSKVNADTIAKQNQLLTEVIKGERTSNNAQKYLNDYAKLESKVKASKSNNSKLPPSVRLEDPSTFDKFDMANTVARQMFPNQANSDAVKSGRITAYEALDPDQQFEVMVNVPGTPVENTIAVMSISDQAIRFSRNADAPNKGISVWDFDDTLATTKSNVLYTMPDGTEGTLTAEQFAKQGEDLLDQGAEFDFSEFEKVTKGAKGPMFEKAVARNRKFGNDNVFILTARTQAAAEPIHQFLKAIGLDIPLNNIVGLGNSTPEAKARWVVSKAAEGYNDFYFADDAYKNVKAVQDALSVLDVKSKVRQAYVKHSKSEALDKGFNDILEQTTGIASEKEYKKVKAEVAGASRGKVFRGIPYSAQDFVGLLYETLSKGKLGDSQMAWYKEHLIKPYARAMNDIDNARLSAMQDYRALKKQLGFVPKNLRKKLPGEPFTREQAVRVYIWNNLGYDVPGISQKDLKELTEYVFDNADLQVFADQVMAIQKGEYAKPKQGWPAGTITTDIQESINTGVRAKYLQQWQDNVDVIFSEKNMNKLEAAYGKPYRKAMENMLQRMKTGRNRTFSDDSLTGRFTDWLQGSIGTIMFFNTRSALLQTISSVNFINFTDNNPLAAAKAFANQKQYWSDFMTLANSDFLKARRSGLRFNVTEADIANMAKEGGPRAVVNKLLQLGFAPTQIADSFAIASGGATFYRNRIKSLMKQGMSQTEAETRAFEDFRENAEESQQSSRPDRISMQQAGPLGRLILAFANTPAQYARLTDKAIRDLKNNRGDAKTNISKIIYYTTVQNLIFNAIQQAIFAMAFDDEEPEDEEKKDKYISIANGMADSLLRGTGFAGAAISVGKNAIIRIFDEMEKKQPKLEKVGYELTKISPPISAKLSRINQAARSYQWDKDQMINGGWGLDNPAYLAAGNVVSALTNVPIDRGIKKANNIVRSTESDLELWERLALLGGWQDWEIGLDEETKQNKPQPRKTKRKVVKKRKVIKK